MSKGTLFPFAAAILLALGAGAVQVRAGARRVDHPQLRLDHGQ
jgi:hypothetical protein